MATYTNKASLYENSQMTTTLADASGNYSVFDSTTLTMSKSVNNPQTVYFPSDPITFTITITNNSTNAVNGLYFQDPIDSSVVPASGSTFQVTTTSGTITSQTSPVTISDINIPSSGTVTITISGVINSTTSA